MSSLVVGAVEAGQQDFEISVAADSDAEHFACDPAVESLDPTAFRIANAGVEIDQTKRADVGVEVCATGRCS